MGIPQFNGQLIKSMLIEYKDAKPGTFPGYVSGMLIDLNDLLHFFSQKTYYYGAFSASPKEAKDLAKKSDSELLELFISRVLSRLDMYLEEMSPTEYFIVTVDGPVPLAKIAQQRIRRLGFGAGGKKSSERFDYASLSPGTSIMEAIHLRLEAWFKERSDKELLPPFACYSSHHEPGEGEHKMIQILLRNHKRIPPCKGMHFICGQDSDLTMLGTLLPFRNVVHYREDRDHEAKHGVPTANIIMVDLFKRFVYKSFLRDRVDIDFVLAYFVFGNDFLPKNPALVRADSTMKDLSTAYIQNGKRLVDLKTGKIIRENFINFLKYFTPLEKANLDLAAFMYNPKVQTPYPILTKNTFRSARGRTEINLEGFKKDWYGRAMECYNTNMKITYPEDKSLLYTDMDEFKRDMFENYLQMLQWTLDYYLRRDIAWNFQYKFYFSPLMSDLAELDPSGEILRPIDNWRDESSIVRQLIMISHPAKVEEFIPKSYYPVLMNENIKRMSPDKPTYIFMDGKKTDKEHLHTIILPLADHKYYEDIISKHKKYLEPRFKVNLRYPDVYINEVKSEGSMKPDSLGGVHSIGDGCPVGSHTKVLTSEKFRWTDEIIR